MKEKNIVTLEIDAKQIDMSIESALEGFGKLNTLAKEIGTSITKAFAPIHSSLVSIQGCINTMSINVSSLTANMQTLSESLMPSGEETGGALNYISTAIAGLSLGVDVIADWEKIQPVITTVIDAIIVGLGGLPPKVAIVVAAILAVIAAITLLALNWDTVSASLEQSSEGLKEFLGEIWRALKEDIIQPVIEFIGEACDNLWERHLGPLCDYIGPTFESIGQSLMILWESVIQPFVSWIISILAPIIVTVIDVVLGAVSVVVGFVSDIIGVVMVLLDGLLQFLAGVFTGEWEKAWGGIVKIFESIFGLISGVVRIVINAIVLIINVFIGALYSVIAGIVNLVGGITGVVGNIIGIDLSLKLPTKPPQIPYCAKGAVLPANKPFLAVVGDQRHGTNVEAPLTTIQEAVAVVMDEHISAMMAGFRALLEEQRATRQTIEGIQIGDSVIGQAADRYRSKMAVIRGGW